MPADEISGPAPSVAHQDSIDEPDEQFDEGEWDGQVANVRRDRTVRAVAAAIVLVVIIILALLLLRTCGTTTTKASTGDKSIVAVPAQVRAENAVSVWIKPGADLRQVLSSAGVRATSTRAMGEGLYFVFLPDGESAPAVVARLKRSDRVHDAGFVYDQLKVEPLKSGK